MSEESPSPVPKSPFKTRFEVLGYFFGSPLESFDNLLPVPTSTTSVKNPLVFDNGKPKPTDFQILKHWINIYDKTRTSIRFPESNSVIWRVADNLIEFWRKNSSEELV